jgi:GNAT superfamily N-acetyltransferase
MSSKISIKPLNEFPQYAPILAYWSHTEWYGERNIDFSVNVSSYIQRSQNNSLPITLIAFYDSIPAGMVSIKMNDLWNRTDLSPWLASLFVYPKFRGLGISKQLVNAVVLSAKSFNFNRMFLFIGNNSGFDLRAFYSRLGWQYFEDCVDNDGRESVIMCLEL